jgi:hypothetical protein
MRKQFDHLHKLCSLQNNANISPEQAKSRYTEQFLCLRKQFIYPIKQIPRSAKQLILPLARSSQRRPA